MTPTQPNHPPAPVPAQRIPYACDDGAGARARLGLIVLQGDETIEGELSRLLLADGVSLFVSRIPMADQITPKNLAQMRHNLQQAAALLPPVQVAGYACTSGAATLGSAAIAKLASAGAPNAQITDPLAALLAAMAALGARRLALAAPYAGAVCATLCAVLQQHGITPTALATFNQPSDAIVARINAESVRAAATAAARQAPCDAVFISCTNLRTLPLIQELEAELNIPVLSSNQTLAWRMATLAALTPAPAAPGALFATQPPVPHKPSE